MPRRSGFTLLEVLLALLLITTAVLGLAGILGPITALAGRGRALGRIALVLESRLDLLRAELLRGAPGCALPGAGTMRHPDGVVETWSASPRAGTVELVIAAALPGKSGSGPDTLLTRLTCP